MTNNERIENFKECFTELDRIIPIIDKIGSGFEESERTALALLLYFKEENVLEKIAKIRKIISLNLQKSLSNEEFDELIEQDIDFWRPPYEATKEELLKMIEEI